MNKEDFLKTLDASLIGCTWSEKKEILYDYEEHFRIGLENGKTEEELIAELGEPEYIAKQYETSEIAEESLVINPQIDSYENESKNISTNRNTAENVSISVIAALSLLIFNLIFIVGPFIGLLGALVGLFAGAIGAFAGGLTLTFGTIFSPFLSSFVSIPYGIPAAASVLFGIGTTAFGMLFFIGDCYVAKYFFKGTMKYINWNLSIIKRQVT